jgi:hypothetical protein
MTFTRPCGNTDSERRDSVGIVSWVRTAVLIRICVPLCALVLVACGSQAPETPPENQPDSPTSATTSAIPPAQPIPTTVAELPPPPQTPAPKPKPVTTTKAPAPPPPPDKPANCHPAYPTVCIPPAPPDLDCKDVSYTNFKVLSPDPHRFDQNKDGGRVRAAELANRNPPGQPVAATQQEFQN